MSKSKWEALAEMDRRFSRRSAELRAARAAHEAMAPETAPEIAPLSAWWGVALIILAAACAGAFAVVAQ